MAQPVSSLISCAGHGVTKIEMPGDCSLMHKKGSDQGTQLTLFMLAGLCDVIYRSELYLALELLYHPLQE